MEWMITHESRVSVLQAWVHVRQELCDRTHREARPDASDLRRRECSNDRLRNSVAATLTVDCCCHSSSAITTARRRRRAMWAWYASSGPTRPTSVSANGAWLAMKNQRCTFEWVNGGWCRRSLCLGCRRGGLAGVPLAPKPLVC